MTLALATPQATTTAVPNERWCATTYCLTHSMRHRYRVAIRGYRPWLRSVRQCESHGNYRISTGNGFYGAYQFLLSTWHSVGGHGYPHHAAPLAQDHKAVRLRHRAGTSPWPVCG